MSVESDFLLFRKYNISGKQLSLANLLEILGIVLILLFMIYSISIKNFLGRDQITWIKYFVIMFSGAMLGIPALAIVFGTSDYRFKMGVHLLILATSLIIFTTLLELNDVFDKSSVLEIIQEIGVLYLLLMISGFGAAFSLYIESQIYFEEFEKATNAFKKGNYDYKVTNEKVLEDKTFSIIATSMNDILNTTKNLVKNLNNTNIISEATKNFAVISEELTSSAEEVASTSQAMSNGATSQTELIASTNENIHKLQDIVNDIVKKIQLNTQEVSQISLQTNILALNAGIEASRAGDYGRGFTVVADNVRKLSDQSKSASERIANVANEIQDTLENEFSKIIATMINIVSVSEETAASAEEVAAAAEEMTASVTELNSSSMELSGYANQTKDFIEKQGMIYLLDNIQDEEL